MSKLVGWNGRCPKIKKYKFIPYENISCLWLKVFFDRAYGGPNGLVKPGQ